MTENEMREIEKMATYLDENCAGLFVLGYANPLPIVDFVAKLYSAGCRIVENGAVVLKKDEYDELLADSSERSRQAWTAMRLDVCEQIQQAYTDARKETAREILDLITRAVTVMRNDRMRMFDIRLNYETYYGLKDMLEREYGVEVDK